MKPIKLILLIALLCAALSAGYLASQAKDDKAEVALQAAIKTETVDGDLRGAIEQYKKIAALPGANRATVATALLRMGQCHEKLGDADIREARKAYEQLVREYADQAELSKVAQERLDALTRGASGRAEVAKRLVWAAGTDAPIGISSDGRYAVYRSSESGDLWLRDLPSGRQRRITQEASRAERIYAYSDAVFSPDNKLIAYDWWVRDHGEIRLSALNGSSSRVLHSGQDGRWMKVSSWMPDGRRLLTLSYDRKANAFNQRHIISLSDGSIRDIGQPEAQQVNWGYPSPDGQYIAYGLKGDINIYDTSTEQDSVLIQNPTTEDMVGWTPDSSGILFVSDRSGTRDLYLLGMENGRTRGNLELLQRNLVASQNLLLTRDGRLFQIESKGFADSYIASVDEQTGKMTGPRSLVDPNYPNAVWPRWSPDGKLLYYEIFKGDFREQNGVLVIRSEETGQSREITPRPKLQWYNPVISPDGSRFAATGHIKGNPINFGVFAINSENGEVSQLVKISTEKNVANPDQDWSPDGQAIFYWVRSLENSKEFILRRRDLTTGEEKDILRRFNPQPMKISPDGTRFVYSRKDGMAKSFVLGILDIQSGRELELWRVSAADSSGISGLAWVPGGRFVLAVKGLKQGAEIWRFPAGGGPGEKLYFFSEGLGFVMHPSGKRVAFTLARENYELWVMENFLPAAKAAK